MLRIEDVRFIEPTLQDTWLVDVGDGCLVSYAVPMTNYRSSGDSKEELSYGGRTDSRQAHHISNVNEQAVRPSVYHLFNAAITCSGGLKGHPAQLIP